MIWRLGTILGFLCHGLLTSAAWADCPRAATAGCRSSACHSRPVEKPSGYCPPAAANPSQCSPSRMPCPAKAGYPNRCCQFCRRRAPKDPLDPFAPLRNSRTLSRELTLISAQTHELEPCPTGEGLPVPPEPGVDQGFISHHERQARFAVWLE